MKNKFFFSLAALALVFGACNKDLHEGSDLESGAKSAVTLPAPFESLAGEAVDAKAFDRFGQPFDPRDNEKPVYVADGIFFVKMKPSNEKNAKMANILVFEEQPTPGVLTVQVKINGNKCFSYVFDAEAFAGKVFWTDNGNSVRFTFVPGDTPPPPPPPTGSISGKVEDVPAGTRVELHVKTLAKAGLDIPGYTFLKETVTAPDGSFSFENLPEDNYIVAVRPEGKEPVISDEIPLGEGQKFTTLNITPPQPPVTGGKYVTFTTRAKEFVVPPTLAFTSIRIMSPLNGSTVTIDMGDGSEKIVVTEWNPWGYYVEHTYTDGASSHTVTITGEIGLLEIMNAQLTSLDVSNHPTLGSLTSSNNQLTSLDVSKNTALTSLVCSHDPLINWQDVINTITSLSWLACTNNQLTSLDVSKHTELTGLVLSGNQLTSLDVSNNTALTSLRCEQNRLTSLDVSNNTALRNLYIQNNLLEADALNALFRTLNRNDVGSSKYIYIANNPGTATCNLSFVPASWRVDAVTTP